MRKTVYSSIKSAASLTNLTLNIYTPSLKWLKRNHLSHSSFLFKATSREKRTFIHLLIQLISKFLFVVRWLRRRSVQAMPWDLPLLLRLLLIYVNTEEMNNVFGNTFLTLISLHKHYMNINKLFTPMSLCADIYVQNLSTIIIFYIVTPVFYFHSWSV